MNVDELIFNAAGLPERTIDTGVLSTCWANKWHVESINQLVMLVRGLIAKGDVVVSPVEGRASSWEEMFHRSLDLPGPARCHVLYTQIGMMEDMQVAVSETYGSPLREEFSRYRLTEEKVDELVASAMANIRVLEQGLTKYVELVLEGPVKSVGCIEENGEGVAVDIGEALTSVFLSKDAGQCQSQIRAEVVGAYLRAMADLRDAPYPYAQQFLNGWGTVRV